jgi:LysM domain
MAGDSPIPITKIDGGPQQFNIDSYYYDGQPVAKTVKGAGDTKPVKTAQTTVADPTITTVDNTPKPAVKTPVDKTVVDNSTGTEVPKKPATGGRTGADTRKAGCSTINYGDSGSGPHDYDNWNADSDRTHAKPGSTAEKWWQANDQLTKDLKTDNCIYTVKFGDSLSSIAQRELVTEGKEVNKQSLKDEMAKIVSLNDCHYQSLDNKQDRIQEGWKLVLRGDCPTDTQPVKAPPPPPQREVQHEVAPPPPPPPPQREVQNQLPPPPLPPLLPQQRPEAYYPPPPPPMQMPIPMNFGLAVPPPLYMRRPLLEFDFGRRHHYPRYPQTYQYQNEAYQYQNGGYQTYQTGGALLQIDLGGGGRHHRWR